MKQIRKKTGDSHKKLFLGNSPSRKIGDVWKEEVDESAIVVSNEVMAIKIIVGKFEDLLRKSNFNKKQKIAKSLGIKVTMRGKHSVSVEQDEEIGTVTGPHIVGTGDDSTTVVVRRKKKKQRNSKIKEEGSLQLEKYLKEVEEVE